MTTDLAAFIQSTPLVDTHEHQHPEKFFIEEGPDVLGDLFAIYVGSDVYSAGAELDDAVSLIENTTADPVKRWNAIKPFWEYSQYTGFGEATRLAAKIVYDMDELTLENILAAEPVLQQIRQPGGRRRLLEEVANLDHVQIDDFTWPCLPDPAGADFFLHDLSWAGFCRGKVEVEALHAETGIEVVGLNTLQEAMAGLFAKYAPTAIAVKAQLPYERTLVWEERADADASRVLAKSLRGDELSEAEALCLGDWCWARGVEQTIEHNLPFKLHTGYLAGNFGDNHHSRIRPSSFSKLLLRYPEARFVLMHISYPFSDELIALAKHHPGVYVDMCWAWAINPFHAADFVRRYIHAVPSNKLFGFGGDSFYPTLTVGYAAQARAWLNRALQAEIDDGLLTEAQAMHLAGRFMRENQYDCFDVEGTRAALAACMAD